MFQHVHSLLDKLRKFLKSKRIYIIGCDLCTPVYHDHITYR